jgi:glycosyltransferase involved in cell wall biosynthesis
MVRRLERELAVRALDISPESQARGLRYHATKLRKVLRALKEMTRGIPAADRRLYLPSDAGWGMAYTSALAGRARRLGYRIWLHHHNYSYIARRERRMEIVCRAAGPDAVHILLCERMEREFRARYPRVRETRVVSNAGFVAAVPCDERDERPGLRLGLLGNLDEAKGLWIAIECLEQLARRVPGIRLILGGPVIRRGDRTRLRAVRRGHGDAVEDRGPLDDAAKLRFYRDIDVLLFPSRLREGQPLVVLEALASGVPVVAYGEGCIPALLQQGCGEAIDPGAPFVPAATARLEAWAADSAGRLSAGRAAVRRFSELKRTSDREIAELMSSLRD